MTACACGAELVDGMICPNPAAHSESNPARRADDPIPVDRAAYERRRKVVAAIHVALEALSDSDLQAVARFAFRLVPEDERKDGAT